MKLFRKLICLISFAVVFVQLPAQQGQLYQEVETSPKKQFAGVIPLEDLGLLLVIGPKKLKNKDNEHRFILFDKNLKELWSQDLIIHGKLFMQSYQLSDGHLYYNLGNNNSGKYAYLDVDVQNYTIGQVAGELDGVDIWHGLFVHGKRLLCPVSANDGVSIHVTDLSTANSSIVEVVANASFLSSSLAPGSDEMCIACNQKEDKQLSTHLAMVDTSGKLINDILVEDVGEERINRALTMRISSDTTIIIGTYSVRSSGATSGLHFGMIHQGKIKTLRYHAFTDFEHFFDYLPKAYRDYIDYKIEKKQKRGSDLKFDPDILMHPVVKLGDKFLVLAEVLYPEWKKVSNGNTTSYVFEGFRYTHATLACFDIEGNLVWDQCFPFKDHLSPSRKKYTRMDVMEGNEIEMVMQVGDTFSTMVIKDGVIIKERKSNYIESLETGWRLHWDSKTTVEFWYDRQVIVSGYYKARDQMDNGSKKKKTVFRFLKLEI